MYDLEGYKVVVIIDCLYSRRLVDSTQLTHSLAGQPLLTQKARKGLVNEGTSTCPQVEYMTYQSNCRV